MQLHLINLVSLFKLLILWADPAHLISDPPQILVSLSSAQQIHIIYACNKIKIFTYMCMHVLIYVYVDITEIKVSTYLFFTAFFDMIFVLVRLKKK